MTVDCLVCGKSTSVTHMGLEACRACAVFYNRNKSKGDKLRCVNGTLNCMDSGRTAFWCRKCRLVRFEEVLSAAWGTSSVGSSSTEHITHDKFECTQLGSITTLKISEGSILERIRVHQQALSAFRCAEELFLLGKTPSAAEADELNCPLVPSTYQLMDESTKILINGLLKFCQNCFPDFATLQPSDKWLLIRNYEKIFQGIDSELRTLRRFGKGSSNLFGTYLSYVSPEFVDYYFSDCPDTRSIAPAAQVLYKWLQENVTTLKKQVHLVDPTEDEFLALIGLALWSVENMESSDAVIALAARYRTEIINELSAHYRCTIGEEKGASRVGALMCLLQEYRRVVMTLNPDYEIYLMLGAYDENTLMNKLPVL